MATDHAGCPDILRGASSELGVDVTVSAEPPLIRGPYTTHPYRCPHGSLYWIEPTGEQLAAWARDGVR